METETPRPESPADAHGTRDRSLLVANVLSAVTALIGLVQALRADPWWPVWILVGVVALGGLMAYRLRQRRWRPAAVSFVVLLLLVGGGTLLALTRAGERPGNGTPAAHGATSAAPAPDGPTSGTPPATAASSPAADATGPGTEAAATFFSDVVQLEKDTGVDLDDRRAVRRYEHDAAVDLYLEWGQMLYSSARHSAMYDDSNEGPEEGAAARCRTYREAKRDTFTNRYVGGGNQQFCFTTSAGRPAWVQVVNTEDDGGMLLKVTVWES
ncbi:hypothetical protein [Micromonospora sp. NPDC126480]|uniref:hypothetical protein n=1 Tax=Micromonospora sp. NPDC126480 TaxID=3155312 RepID=UPI00331B2A97